MNRHLWPLASIALLVDAPMAQTSIDLAGKVTDANGTALSQVIVSLKASKLADTTDSQGNFSLVKGSTNGISREAPIVSTGLSASLRDDKLRVALGIPSEVVITIRALDGGLVSRRTMHLDAGVSAVGLPPAAPGIHFATVKAGSDEIRLGVVSTGHGWQETNTARMAATRTLAFSDTLKATKAGYQDASIAITNPVQSGMAIKLAARDDGSWKPIDTVIGGCPVKLEGWAEYGHTTGGGNATPQKVTSVDELRTLAKDTVPRVLLLEGTYDLGANYLKVGSNKTFLGIGKNTVVKAGVAGFSLRLSHNVILRNLTVQGGGDVGTEGGDAVTATQAERLWFDHLTITDGPDGILDLTQGTTNATVSWCKIYYTSSSQPHRYAMQFSSGSYVSTALTDRGKLDITMHHNWFGALVDQRMPRHLWGRGHVYSSFYNSPNNTYCIGAGSWASILIENNYFKDVNDPHRYQDDCPTFFAASGNTYDNAVGKKETGLFAGNSGCLTGGADAVIPGPWTPPYKYTLTESKDVPDLVKRCAGPQ